MVWIQVTASPYIKFWPYAYIHTALMKLKYVFKDCLELSTTAVAIIQQYLKYRQIFNGKFHDDFPATQHISIFFPPLNSMLLANKLHDCNQGFVGTRKQSTLQWDKSSFFPYLFLKYQGCPLLTLNRAEQSTANSLVPGNCPHCLSDTGQQTPRSDRMLLLDALNIGSVLEWVILIIFLLQGSK